ncbi:MAG TPA: DNA topology modulation protein [Pyrinomonadaceae bacterium]|jgi:adenylate kinase family enzyme|nr:DNA topology modulation protein [Pyrinomonadaceae bacterium]
MRRILVIGSGGSGKSTVATRLGALLNLEVSHLDKFFWQPGWVKPATEDWVQAVTELMNRDSWILDGNYSGTLELRFQKCDTIIFLDLSRWLCLWRIVRRVLRYRNDLRPDMAEGCQEKLDLEFVRWVWNYPHRTKPKVVKLLRERCDGKEIVWLRSRREVEGFLRRFE